MKLESGILAAVLVVGAMGAARAEDDDLDFFEKKVRPVLAERCYKCHATAKPKGGLRVDTRAGLLAGGQSGPAIVPGDPARSLLVTAIKWTDDTLQMPPKKPLEKDEVAAIEEWIKRGAPMPVARPEAAAGKHWAFEPVRDPAVPATTRKDWGHEPLDAFVLAKLEAKGLAPGPEADRRTLLRRASFDLVGLPPAKEEVDAFVGDSSPDAFEKVVDRLLASPRFGERWGRHWLDVARYADSKGYVFAEERRYPYAYVYRDWVVRAFNEDLPYDEFLVKQIAGDHLVRGDDRRDLAALGFLTLGRRFLNNVPDIVDDRIDVVTRGTMALTVSCARCHDHKFDPIPTRDYYSLYGVFASSHEPAEPPLLDARPDETPERAAFDKELALRLAAVEEFKKNRHGEILADLKTEKKIALYLDAARIARDAGSVAHERDLNPHMIERWRHWLETTKKDPAFELWHALEHVPEASFAAVASATVARITTGVTFERPPASMTEVARRYAAWLVGKPCGALDLPLGEIEAVFDGADANAIRDLRVKVDELKATHPGAPARAPSLEENEKPFDPQVFVRGNPWNQGERVPRRFLSCLEADAKPWAGSGRLELARAIASRENPLTARVFVNRVLLHLLGAPLVRTLSDFGRRSDPPTNPELLDHLARRFMDSGWSMKKLIRTVVLSSTYRQASQDRADARAVDPENVLLWRANRKRLDFEATRDALLAVSGRLDLTLGGRPVDLAAPRRTLYAFIDRQNLPGLFRSFDFANPDAHAPRRFETTVPQQALFFMNAPFVLDSARSLAARAKDVDAIYALAFARAPDDDERALARDFLARATPARPPTWTYGWGEVEGDRTKTFTPLPHWTGSGWQGGPAIPDAKLAWCLLTATGGHPGKDQAHAVIRRWNSPVSGVVAISGRLRHPVKEGDGVRGRVVSSDGGVLGTWTAHNRAVETELLDVDVKVGTTLDFVVDCRTNDGFDTFEWAPRIRAADAEGEWDALHEFHGPGAPLSPWERYAQVLLETNEFVFVD